MFHFLNNFNSFNFLLLSSLILNSCATNLQSSKFSGSQDINLSKDFTIEGKFKIKLNNNSQSGYFIVSKRNNSVSLKIGKNYLLPEKEFFYEINDYLTISQITYMPLNNLNEKLFNEKLSIQFFLEALLGLPLSKEDSFWKLIYPDNFQVIDGYKFPFKIRFNYESFNLEIVLNKVVIK